MNYLFSFWHKAWKWYTERLHNEFSAASGALIVSNEWVHLSCHLIAKYDESVGRYQHDSSNNIITCFSKVRIRLIYLFMYFLIITNQSAHHNGHKNKLVIRTCNKPKVS